MLGVVLLIFVNVWEGSWAMSRAWPPTLYIKDISKF
jgi:hypothetical protein